MKSKSMKPYFKGCCYVVLLFGIVKFTQMCFNGLTVTTNDSISRQFARQISQVKRQSHNLVNNKILKVGSLLRNFSLRSRENALIDDTVTQRYSTPAFVPISTMTRQLWTYAEYKSLKDGSSLQLRRCQTCAIIIPSGHLIGRTLGREIDGHSCVIRTNIAPTTDYNVDVGKRTTIRILSRQSLDRLRNQLNKDLKNKVKYFDPNAPNRSVVLQYGAPYQFTKLLFSQWPNLKVYKVNGSRGGKVKSDFQEVYKKHRVYITNGFQTLNLAHDFCDFVDVYGMSPFDQCIKVKENKTIDVRYHYFTDYNKTECSLFGHKPIHDFMAEKNAYKNLYYNNNRTTFKYPTWTL